MAATFDAPAPAAPATTIVCCLCGTKIAPNKANMCINCLKTQVDITDGISKQVTMFFCRGCGKYQAASNAWLTCALESRELLALCLKKIKGLHKDVKLVDAGFVWTEPHSRRLKVKLTIQKEVMNAAILQQVFIVEFVLAGQQCLECQKSFTEHTWNAVVQVRQKVKHKRTFFFLEQILLKHGIADKAMYCKEMPGGLDFYYSNKSDANHLLSFLKGAVAIKETLSKRLISADEHSNTYNYKFSLYAEIAPICKDDLCVLEPKLAQQLGGVCPLMLCYKVSSTLYLIDTMTSKFVEVNSGLYWRYPFRALMVAAQMTEYHVLSIDRGDGKDKVYNKHGATRNKIQLAEVQVAKSSDFGVNDTTYHTHTHLGNILKEGDTVMGYDLSHCNLSDTIMKPLRGKRLPNIVLVRKSYPKRTGERKWKLKSLPNKVDADNKKKTEIAQDDADMELLKQELEQSKDLRSRINMYAVGKSPAAAAAAAAGGASRTESKAKKAAPAKTDAKEAKGMEEADDAEGDDAGDDDDNEDVGVDELLSDLHVSEAGPDEDDAPTVAVAGGGGGAAASRAPVAASGFSFPSFPSAPSVFASSSSSSSSSRPATSSNPFAP